LNLKNINMNLINKFKIKSKVIFFSFIMLISVFFIISSCSNDETQTVVTFKELVIQDEFDVMELLIVLYGVSTLVMVKELTRVKAGAIMSYSIIQTVPKMQ